MSKERKRIFNIVYLILILLIIGCLCVIGYLLIEKKDTLTPDYAPGTIDTNAIKEKDNEKKMKANDGGGAMSISYSNVVAVDRKSKDIKLYYKNPSKSRASVVLELVIINNDKEYVIGKTDLLPPGYALYKMKLDTDLNLQAGGYKGLFKITIYDEETGAKQIVNSKIDVSIEVK